LGTPSDQRIFHLLVFLLPKKTSKDIDSIFFIGKVESGHKHLQDPFLFHPNLFALGTSFQRHTSKIQKNNYTNNFATPTAEQQNIKSVCHMDLVIRYRLVTLVIG
jgi:hypothetical protein